MTQMLDVRFPTDISLGATGGPEFLTSFVEMPNGHEQSQIKRDQPRARYKLAYAFKTAEQAARLRSLYYLTKGRGLGFYYKDPLDHQVTDQLIAEGDGSKTSFQLIKTYGYENLTYSRRITRPLGKTLELKIDGAYVEDYQLDPKGIVKLMKPLPKKAKLTASFEFDIPVRFDVDLLAQRFEAHETVTTEHLELIEVLES